MVVMGKKKAAIKNKCEVSGASEPSSPSYFAVERDGCWFCKGCGKQIKPQDFGGRFVCPQHKRAEKMPDWMN